MIGEDADLEKSGRILNRVIEWRRGGITTEADQRHVSGILNLDSACANDSATACAVDRKKGNNARGDETKWRTCGEQGQPGTPHDWDDESDRSGRRGAQMTSDGESDSEALTGGDITLYRALLAHVSYRSQDRPVLQFASMWAWPSRA